MESILELIEDARLWPSPGGIHPDPQKQRSRDESIRELPLVNEYILPVTQHIGNAGKVLVHKGQTVHKGQLLVEALPGLSAAVHAPTSGTISDIKPHASAHPSAIPTDAIFLQADGFDTWREQHPIAEFKKIDKQEILDRIIHSGITGLGGASFPTHIKLSTKHAIELLIVNGVECEPFITSDDRLMREHSAGIIAGIDVVQHLLEFKQVIIAIEDDKPEAIAAMQAAAQTSHLNIRVQAIPTKYPSGGEKQLIQILTGQEVPSRQLPANLGIVVQNVGTLFAIHNAVIHDIPLIERIVTVTGDSVKSPSNLRVRLGTPIKHLLEATEFKPHSAGFFKQHPQRLIMGGPMMGFQLPDGEIPVVKATNCVLAPNAKQLPYPQQERSCIRCSQCADACPVGLLPQQLQWYAKANDHDQLKAHRLSDCIECGACAFVCPSNIPLVHYYRVAKADIRQQEQEKAKAQKAKLRFDARQERLEREEQERLEKHRKASEARKKKQAESTGDQDKIAAALARVAAKKSDSSANSTTAESPAKSKAAAAIARAKAKKAAQQSTQQDATVESENAAADDKKSQVAAAIARAKAKKAAQNAEHAEPSQDDADAPANDNKSKVAAAIARAKAKKAAQNAEQAEPSQDDADAPANDNKSKVAAAIARAKAKKAAQTAEHAEPSQGDADALANDSKAKVTAAIARAKAKKAAQNAEQAEPSQDDADAPANDSKAKVAAAIARAKAKKAAQNAELEKPANSSAEQEASSTEHAEANNSAEPSQDNASSPVDDKKAKVAAAIARAKAKKAAQQTGENADSPSEQAENHSDQNAPPESREENTSTSEQESHQTSSEAPVDDKKAKIAAAIARAKAKKAAQQGKTQD